MKKIVEKMEKNTKNMRGNQKNDINLLLFCNIENDEI